jgi:hypothetical protein
MCSEQLHATKDRLVKNANRKISASANASGSANGASGTNTSTAKKEKVVVKKEVGRFDA